MGDKTKGLYNKFIVRRVDGTSRKGKKHHGCEYFVLDFNHDPLAHGALEAYAEACRWDYPFLYDDLNDILAKHPSRSCIGIPPERAERRKQGLEEFDCEDPAVVPLGNGVWFCLKHAPWYAEKEHLPKHGLETMRRRLRKVVNG